MITTGCGDTGKSSTISQRDISKGDLIFDILGTVDELSAFLGIAKCECDGALNKSIEYIQKELLTIGGYFAGGGDFDFSFAVKRIEEDMNTYEPDKVCPNGFVLYGGNKAEAFTDAARAVSRRLERLVVRFFEKNEAPDGATAYFNRLSDYLFILARCAEKGGIGE